MTKEEIVKMKISRVEKEIRDTPYDKSSEHHHGVLKAKLSKLKDELDSGATKGGGGGIGYAIKHSGDASVVLVGLPSVGKSTLLNELTNAESKVGNYDFTTLGVVPGMMEYNGVKIQLLDLPGIVEGAAGNKGFGRKVISVIRASDMVVLMTDVKRLNWFEIVEKELYKSGMRFNIKPPKIEVRRTDKGAIQVIDPYKSFDKEMVIDVVKEMGFGNAIVHLGEKIENVDRLIDGLVKTRKYMPMIKVVTKMDMVANQKKLISELESKKIVPMSVEEKTGVEDFKKAVWEGLGLVRIYLKRERNSEADKKNPLIVKSEANLDKVLQRISNEMRDDVSRAYIWGSGARFPGQEVSFKTKVFDEMEVWFGR